MRPCYAPRNLSSPGVWRRPRAIVSASGTCGATSPCNHIGYTLFVILIPRVIHDLTAYTVYITHDRNRNRQGRINPLYRLTGGGRLSPLLLLPALSIAIAFVLSSHQHYPVISIAILTVSFLHYYFEGFIWRGPNPHRNYVNFIR